MKIELAVTGAGHGDQPCPGSSERARKLGHTSESVPQQLTTAGRRRHKLQCSGVAEARPAPFAVRLEVNSGVGIEFEVPIQLPEPPPPAAAQPDAHLLTARA